MKKILGLFSILFLSIMLTACSGDVYEGLVGSWVWEDNASFVITFNEDGTGSWSGVFPNFDWEVRRGSELRMQTSDGVARWAFDINGDILHIDHLDLDEEWTYIRASGNDTQDAPDVDDTNENEVSSEANDLENEISSEVNELSEADFIGSWVWEGGSDFVIELNADGSGSWTGVADSMDWSFTNGELRMTVGGVIWRWEPTINGDVLHIDSLQNNEEWTYIRQ